MQFKRSRLLVELLDLLTGFRRERRSRFIVARHHDLIDDGSLAVYSRNLRIQPNGLDVEQLDGTGHGRDGGILRGTQEDDSPAQAGKVELDAERFARFDVHPGRGRRKLELADRLHLRGVAAQLPRRCVRPQRSRFLGIERHRHFNYAIHRRHVREVIEGLARFQFRLAEEFGFAGHSGHAARPGNVVARALRVPFPSHLERFAVHHAAQCQGLIFAETLAHRGHEDLAIRGFDGGLFAELGHDLSEPVDGEPLVFDAEKELLAVLLALGGGPVEVADAFALDGGGEPVFEGRFGFFLLGCRGTGLRRD